jgi:ADP-ribosylglycohydrolase
MRGAICGDVIGSVYEGRPIKVTDFPLFDPASGFTDDSVLTIAIADALVMDGDYAAALRHWGRRYPHAGYGGAFAHWLISEGSGPYGSWGNGAAMRVSPVAYAFQTEQEVLLEAARSAVVTHDHPEGIKGAQATALAVFLARQGVAKGDLRREIEGRFGYDLSRSLALIRPDYGFDVSCQGSVPEALTAFLQSTDYESAVRNAVSLGGDADTQACIAGAVAEACYGAVPESLWCVVSGRLPAAFLRVIERFDQQYGSPD